MFFFTRLLQQLPSQCAVCHAWPAQPVCGRCVAQFAQPIARCQRCALPVLAGMQVCGRCIVQAPPLDWVVAAVAYAYPWSGLIAQFKFQESPGWARSFATLMRAAPWCEPALEAADWVLPMPLAAGRLRARGFNQSLLLARALAPQRTRSDLLLRLLETAPQSSLARAQRQANVRNAFAVEPMQAAALRGKRVVLVDDVMTSGASLYAAAQVLRQAGAAHITGLVLARTAR